MKKILLTGGGSAGHVTPNISIIEELLSKEINCLYIGSYKGIEREMISQNFPKKVEYYPIFSGKLRRYFSFKNITDPFFIFLGFLQSIYILLKEKPDLVFSKGGYISAPVVFAAKLLGIKIYIHESDSSPGLTTKLTAPLADKIFVPDKTTQQKLSKQYTNVQQVDLPIRKFLYKGDHTKIKFQDPNKPTLLIMGGSLGAKSLNLFLKNNFKKLTQKWNIVHLAGHDHIHKMPSSNSSYLKYDFVQDELADIYAKTDLILARAGATTLQEIKLLKIPSILVPLPKDRSRGEQIQNAKQYSDQFPSQVIPDEDLDLKNFQQATPKVLAKEFPKIETSNNLINYLV